MKRALSHSEVSTLLDCQLKHDFSYVGNVVGDALKPKDVHVNLRAGRAWGACAAEWHRSQGNTMHALLALTDSLDEDAQDMRDAGFYNEDEHDALLRLLRDAFEHYTATSSLMPLQVAEHEIRVAIPSRGSARASALYDFHGFLDGVATDINGRDWIVEFKLRKQLSSLEQISLGRQLKWYAWAWRQTTGRTPYGILLDERLHAAPSPVKFNQNGSVSKVQSCTADMYELACADAEQEPDDDVLDKLRMKKWGQRHTIFLTDADLDEAGWQLRSAGRQLRELESGRNYPIRNPNPMRCPGCAYRSICVQRDDASIDARFERVPPKRDRTDLVMSEAVGGRAA